MHAVGAADPAAAPGVDHGASLVAFEARRLTSRLMASPPDGRVGRGTSFKRSAGGAPAARSRGGSLDDGQPDAVLAPGVFADAFGDHRTTLAGDAFARSRRGVALALVSWPTGESSGRCAATCESPLGALTRDAFGGGVVTPPARDMLSAAPPGPNGAAPEMASRSATSVRLPMAGARDPSATPRDQSLWLADRLPTWPAPSAMMARTVGKLAAAPQRPELATLRHRPRARPRGAVGLEHGTGPSVADHGGLHRGAAPDSDPPGRPYRRREVASLARMRRAPVALRLDRRRARWVGRILGGLPCDAVGLWTHGGLSRTAPGHVHQTLVYRLVHVFARDLQVVHRDGDVCRSAL